MVSKFIYATSLVDPTGTAEAIGDALVVAPLVKAANLHAKISKNTYFYVFGYQTEHGDYPTRMGCIHGEELAYIFGAPLVSHLGHFPNNYSKSEQAYAEAIMSYWSNFARYGYVFTLTISSAFNLDRVINFFQTKVRFTTAKAMLRNRLYEQLGKKHLK